jgi:hypothetical protein
MTLFDLVFVALFLTAVVTLLVAVGTLLAGRRARAAALARRLAAGTVAYLVVVIAVSLLTPRRVLPLGAEQCSDDWCVAVVDARRSPPNRNAPGDGAASRAVYDVTFRLRSRARRVAQRERNVVVYLRDDAGRTFAAEPDARAVPFDTLLQAGESILAARRFLVPAATHDAGIVVGRGGIPFPGCCVIGDEGSLLHRRTVVRLR